MTEHELRESLLEAMAEAALGGHELGHWAAVADEHTGGYEAACSLCGLSTWVGPEGLRYSLLEDVCPRSEDTGEATSGRF